MMNGARARTDAGQVEKAVEAVRSVGMPCCTAAHTFGVSFGSIEKPVNGSVLSRHKSRYRSRRCSDICCPD